MLPWHPGKYASESCRRVLATESSTRPDHMTWFSRLLLEAAAVDLDILWRTSRRLFVACALSQVGGRRGSIEATMCRNAPLVYPCHGLRRPPSISFALIKDPSFPAATPPRSSSPPPPPSPTQSHYPSSSHSSPPPYCSAAAAHPSDSPPFPQPRYTPASRHPRVQSHLVPLIILTIQLSVVFPVLLLTPPTSHLIPLPPLPLQLPIRPIQPTRVLRIITQAIDLCLFLARAELLDTAHAACALAVGDHFFLGGQVGVFFLAAGFEDEDDDEGDEADYEEGADCDADFCAGG